METYVILLAVIAVLIALGLFIRWMNDRRIANKPAKERAKRLYQGYNDPFAQ